MTDGPRATPPPRITIVSTSRAELRADLQRYAPNVAVITIAGIGTREGHARLPSETLRLRITANDIEKAGQSYASKARLFGESDARKILRFVAALPPPIKTLVVQCYGGYSRSVAVVAALRWLMEREAPPPHLTNRHIFQTIVKTAERDLKAGLDVEVLRAVLAEAEAASGKEYTLEEVRADYGRRRLHTQQEVLAYGAELRAAERRALVAIDTLRAAGFVVEDGDPMRKVRRHTNARENVWLDVGDTVGVLGDASDIGNALYLDVIEALDGPEARARVHRTITDTDQG